MDRLNKLNTAKEKISELEEELKENSCTKTWRVRNMENTEGKGGRGYGGTVRKPRVHSFGVTEGGERA